MHAEPAFSPTLEVLIVDDIDQSRLGLAELVTHLGHRVAQATGGEDALRQVRAQLPDVVLLDLLMPDVDGFEVTRRIRAIAADRWVPVIVTSGLQGDAHFCQALHEGADDFLARPVNPELLDAKLRHYARVLELHRQAERSMQRQRDIHDNISDAVLTLDAEGTVLDMNMSACQRFGAASPAQLVGSACRDVTGRTLSELTAGGEVTLIDGGGRRISAEIGTSQWLAGADTRFTLVIRDLTERRAVERLKDEFLATVSHELRTPLTSVAGVLGLVVAGKAGELPTQSRVLLEMADRNARRLSRLIDDLLDLTRLESDRMTLYPRVVRAADLVQEALDANQGYAQRAGVHLAAHVADATAAVRVDPERFLQVVSNLVSNAVKHSPTGATVTLDLAASADGVRLTVRDRGPGIPVGFRDRMFEKFSQADGSDQRAKSGTGLGLYVSRLLVERMGGQIDAGPAGDVGSEFRIDLPRDDAQAPRSRPWLWVVDRDIDTAARLRGWVGAHWQIASANDLRQADSFGLPGTDTVVLADPQGQGLANEFCDGLRRLARGRPVVLYSDAVDDAFVGRQGLPWLRKSGSGAVALERMLARLDRAPAAARSGHG